MSSIHVHLHLHLHLSKEVLRTCKGFFPSERYLEGYVGKFQKMEQGYDGNLKKRRRFYVAHSTVGRERESEREKERFCSDFILSTSICLSLVVVGFSLQRRRRNRGYVIETAYHSLLSLSPSPSPSHCI